MEESYRDIKGWFDFEDLYSEIVASLPDGSRIVEVGACFGRSTAYLAGRIIESGKDIRLDVVDLWPKNFHRFFANMVRVGVAHRVRPMRMPSHLAALHYPDRSVDFVFIDAEHTYSEVARDLRCWLPKVRPGGTLAGHDYHMPGVRLAVDERLVVKVRGNCWVYEVPAISPVPWD